MEVRDKIFIVTANYRMVSLFISKYISVFTEFNLNKSNIEVIQSIDNCRGRSFENSAVILLEDYYLLENVDKVLECLELRKAKTYKISTQSKEFDLFRSALTGTELTTDKK